MTHSAGIAWYSRSVSALEAGDHSLPVAINSLHFIPKENIASCFKIA